MVLLTTTPQILEILSSLPPSALATLASTTPKLPPTTSSTPTSKPRTNTSTDTEEKIENDTDTNKPTTSPSLEEPQPQCEPTHHPLPTTLTTPISHHTLIALSHLRSQTPTTLIPPLNTLLHGTRPYHPPPPPPPPKSASYIALMSRLHAEAEAREYQSLITNSPRRRSSLAHGLSDPNTDSEEGGDEDTLSPTLVLNILLSVVLCAVASFQLTHFFNSDGIRVLVALGVGVVVGVAEAGVYSIYLVKKRRGRERERRRVERKTVVGRVEVGEGEEVRIVRVGDGNGDGTEGKEEIWGRGVNGGMRRRVREKWERERGREMKGEEDEDGEDDEKSK